MDGRRPSSLIAGGILFLIVFGGLTIAALATAELNVATIVIAIGLAVRLRRGRAAL